jgi:asparagine synthase (glutamine-hydrolysing)
MRGLLPDDFLRRTTKTGGGAQTSRGIRAYEPELFGICRDSILAERRIIDLDQVREHAFPRERWMPVRDIDATLICAVFARNHTGGRRTAPVR